MNKIENYINYLFSDFHDVFKINAVKTKVKQDLQQEVINYQNEGYSKEEAFKKAITYFDNPDELIKIYKPNGQTREFHQEKTKLEKHHRNQITSIIMCLQL